jgi:PAS domain S-box-containing protein
MPRGTRKPEEKSTDSPGTRHSLRDEAEEQLTRSPERSPGLDRQTPEQLIHELQVHQVELEIQAEELRRAQLALEDSRDKYLDLYDFAPVGYLTLSDKGLITEANLTGATLLGVERSRLIKERFSKFVAEKDAGVWHWYFVNVLNQKEKRTCTLMLKRGGGPVFPAQLEAILTAGSDGAKTVRIAIIDITNRKQAEEALKESEAKYRALFAAESDGIFVVDKVTGTIIDCSDAITTMYGYLKEEVVGKPNTFISAEPDATREATQDVKGIIPIRYHKRKDGVVFPVEITANVTSVKGRDVIVAAVRDITGRIQADEARRINEERLQMTQEIAHIGCWEYDIKTNLMWGSDEGCRIFGYPKKAGSFPIEAFTSTITERELVIRAFNHLVSEGKEYDLDFIINPKDGSAQRIIHSIGRLERDESGNPIKVTGTNQDITERKQTENALLLSNKKLTLLSSITRHDINNQLLTLDGFLALLRKKVPDPDLADFFNRISKASSRISTMIRFTKEYQQIGINAPVWQNGRTLVDNAAKQAPLGPVMVKNDIPAGTEVFADPLIVKVFYNLMDNAARYGGKITSIRFSVEKTGDDHIIVCEDDGDGIAADEKEKIFERGYGKNTGLGLFLSWDILDITGITIKETGKPGKGARFEMTVPKEMWRIERKGT